MVLLASRSSIRLVVVGFAVALLAASCDFLPEPPGQDDALPPERPRQGPILPTTTTTEPDPEATVPTTLPLVPEVDYRERRIEPFEGQAPTPTLRELDDGTTEISGVVRGPSGGGVGGALVRLERVTQYGEQRLEIRTNNSGRYRARDLSGGRYRVRAWREPDLAVEEPGAVFVENGGSATVDLDVVRPVTFDFRLERGPAFPRVDETVTFGFAVRSAVVDGNGEIAQRPLSGVRVEFPDSSRWASTSESDEARSRGDGFVNWRVECTTPGSETASFTVYRPVALDPDPAPPPPPPSNEADSDEPATTTPRPTATPIRFDISLPRCGVRLPNPDFAVGDSFTPPFAGQIASGRYTVDGPATCAIEFQAWYIDGWLRDTSPHSGNGDLVLSWPARNVRAAPDSPDDCSYTRVQ